LRFAYGDEVRLVMLEPAYWPYNGRSGVVVRIPNEVAVTETGIVYQMSSVEVMEHDGEPRVIDCREDELVMWNGVDQMIAILKDPNE
jgi:hypothetical protein